MPSASFVTGIVLFLAAAFILRRIGTCMVRLALLAIVAMIALVLVGPRYLGTSATASATQQMSAGTLTAGQGAWIATRSVRHGVMHAVRTATRQR